MSEEHGIYSGVVDIARNGVDEVIRLHAENEALREANEAFGKRQEWWNEKMVALEERNAELVEALAWALVHTARPEQDGQYADDYRKARAALAKVDAAIRSRT